jgi:hypothetical protein
LLNPAIVGIVLTGIARLPAVHEGPALNPGGRVEATRPAPAAPAAASAPAVPVTEAIRLDEYLTRLDAWRNEGRITATESARARRLLNAALVGGDRSVHVPLDASGRIDLLALARGQTGSSIKSTKPEERLVARVIDEFDIRMRVKARDMASPANLSLFAGAPAYAAVPARDLGRIVTGALETTPVGELPGGSRLVDALSVLPNTTGLNPGQTFREISALVSDRQRDWMESRVGRFAEGHKIETGLLAFGAITGLRMASPGAARFMDGLGVRMRIWRTSTPDARRYTTGRLVYRNGHVLPELDIEGGARRVIGPTTMRVTAAAAVGAEASDHARGRVALGARWERSRLFADTSATYAYPENLARTELRGGYLAETGLAISGALAATFGNRSGAVGPAPGRLDFELDVTKALLIAGAAGETSLFISTGADSDFNHGYWRGGLVLRLRF